MFIRYMKQNKFVKLFSEFLKAQSDLYIDERNSKTPLTAGYNARQGV